MPGTIMTGSSASSTAQLVPARVPDLTVRAVQIGLTYRAIDPHGIDGDLGPATQAAITAFQIASSDLAGDRGHR